jgi:flagellin
MGGGDLPESGLEALQLIRTMPFRPGAERQVVMITDATVHSAEDGTGSHNTVTDTVADLSADGVIVTVAGPSVPDPRLQAISTGTGGSYHNVNDPSFFTSGFGFPSGPTVGGPLFSVLCSPEGQTIDIRHESLLARDLGIASLDFANEGAALRQVEGALQIAINHAAYLGTSYNRLRDADDFADTMRDVYSASIGAIIDANMEEESARLAALQVQNQIAIKALSIANQDPKLILSLLQPGQ